MSAALTLDTQLTEAEPRLIVVWPGVTTLALRVEHRASPGVQAYACTVSMTGPLQECKLQLAR